MILNPDVGLLAGIITGLMSIVVFIPFLIGMILLSFLSAGIYHLIGKLFKIKEPFIQTYKAVIYGFTPYLLIQAFQYLSFYSKILIINLTISGVELNPFSVWSFILISIGLSKLQIISLKKALLIVFTPLIIATLSFIIFFPSIISVSGLLGGLETNLSAQASPGTEIDLSSYGEPSTSIEQDNYYIKMAMETMDYNYCDLLFFYPERCYGRLAGLSGDSSICETFDSWSQDGCYMYYAALAEDLSTCEMFEHYQDTCISLIAKENNDTSYCELITDDYYKDTCYSDIAINTLNPNLCANILNSYAKDDCYMWVADEALEMNYCENITDSDTKNLCYYYIAQDSNSTAPCEMISESEDIDDCYYMVALNTLNPSLCELSGESKSYCYWHVAEGLNDISYCEHTIGTSVEENCFSHFE